MIKIEERNKKTREEIQDTALELSLTNKYMVLQYPTGLGKSFTMIRIIENILKNKNYNCLILEPEIALIDNLKKEFIKFGKGNLLDQIDIICYASLKKVEKPYTVLVLDEAHHALTDLRLSLLEELVTISQYTYLLSATIEISQIKKFELMMHQEFLVHRITLKKAIEWGILPTPKVGIFKLKLDEERITCSYDFFRGDKDKAISITCPNENSKWKYIRDRGKYPNLHLTVCCTEKQKYEQLCYISESAKQKSLQNPKDEKAYKSWLFSELCVKRFLSEIKTPYLDEFLQDVILDDNRFIVFFGSVSQAEELAQKHNAHLVASKNKESQDLIEQFNNKKISNLYCCKMINEGVTLTDLEIGIIAQLDGKSGSFIQKVGRSLRSIYPQLYIFYYEGTKDESYLENALKKIDKESVTYLDYFYHESN